MSTTTLTSAWEAICLNFFPIFTQPTAQNFFRLATGWILCTTRRTISAIFAFADPRGQRTHDAYHRLFPKARWQPSRLWQILAKLLVAIFYPSGTIPIDLDDTIFHRTGRKVQGAGYFRDAVRSTAKQVVYCWGLNLVVLSLRLKTPWGRELGLPINMRLYRKKTPASLIDLAEAMIRQLAEWFPERRTSGTELPLKLKGRVYWGYSKRELKKESSSADRSDPKTPGKSLETASIRTIAANSPPVKT